MSDRTRILKDLVVVAALVGLVAEEVDFRVFDARDFFLLGQVLQAVGLVPASREDVEGDLSTNGVPDRPRKKSCQVMRMGMGKEREKEGEKGAGGRQSRICGVGNHTRGKGRGGDGT